MSRRLGRDGGIVIIRASHGDISLHGLRINDYSREHAMIGAFVTFSYENNFDERAVRAIADTARTKFEGMPGLRSKAFTLNSNKRQAANFYVWDSEKAARAFFSDEMLERVAGLYGVRPSIEFVEIASLVENGKT